MGADTVSRPREKHERVLSIIMGCADTVPVQPKTKHPVLARPISNPQNAFSAPKSWGPGYTVNDTAHSVGTKLASASYTMVLRLFPPCALISHAQGSSGVVDNMPFAWRGHTKRLATRARPSPDLAVWLE